MASSEYDPQSAVSILEAGRIRPDERDYALRLHDGWPRPPAGWEARRVNELRADTAYLHRPLVWPLDKKNAEDRELMARLNLNQCSSDLKMAETILRFPSAPIYSIHRKHEYQYVLPKRINYHTLRLLRAGWAKDQAPAPVKRIYLLHNGLNEIGNITFYYRIASMLLAQDPACACILRPFPGHLTRSPFPEDYAERPLDRYLEDPGDLFRQFVRYMLETQWLLSAIAPLGEYRVMAGLGLLAQGPPGSGRGAQEPAPLAAEVYNAWLDAFNENPEERPGGEIVTEPDISGIILTLRYLIGWKPGDESPDKPPSSKEKLQPALHAVGYSLGGFVAQSVFFTWPFAISSCTTICSGGPLRDIGLTAFAHREEWELMTNAIRYELASSLIEKRLTMHERERKVAGVDLDYFSCFFRIFHDVFLQEFRGSYRSRVSEFVSRLLFIVGGDDPIVPLRTIIETSPPGGINAVEIANLSHFPEKGDRDWQGFWRPEVCDLLGRYAQRTEGLLFETLTKNWWNKDRTDHVNGGLADDISGGRQILGTRPRLPEFDPATGDVALPSDGFQEELSAMVGLINQGGWLFILRNDLPAVLLGPKKLHRRGTALHHSEELIWRHFSWVREQEMQIERAHNVTIVLPAKLYKWITRRQPTFSDKAEAAAFRVPQSRTLEEMWNEFYGKWSHSRGVLQEFDPAISVESHDLVKLVRRGLGFTTSDLPLLNTLPDMCVGFSANALQQLAGTDVAWGRVKEGFVERARRLQEAALKERAREGVDPGLAKSVEEFNKWVANANTGIRIVKISSGGRSPRFMGLRVLNTRRAQHYFIHAALALLHSKDAAIGRG